MKKNGCLMMVTSNDITDCQVLFAFRCTLLALDKMFAFNDAHIKGYYRMSNFVCHRVCIICRRIKCQHLMKFTPKEINYSQILFSFNHTLIQHLLIGKILAFKDGHIKENYG